MVEKSLRDGMCHVIHSYEDFDNKSMKEYNPNTESSYLISWDVNNQYRQAMQQKLPVDGLR